MIRSPVKAAPPRSKARSDARKPPNAPGSGVRRSSAKGSSPKAGKLPAPAASTKAQKAKASAPATSTKARKAKASAPAAMTRTPSLAAVQGAAVKPSAAKQALPTKGRKPVSPPAAPKQAAPAALVPVANAKPTKREATAPAKAGKTAKNAALPVQPPASRLAKAQKGPAGAPPAPVALKKPARKSIKEAAGVSTDAVARRTGKSWDAWFEVLDSAGAATLDQRGVIAILAQKHGIGPWWQQMIAVGYEAVRGKSEKPPVAEGFQISSSTTLDAPLSRVFRLWNDSSERARWLADDRFAIRTFTASKSIQARWGKGGSHVAISFIERAGRTEVSVQHQQIESRGAAEQMKSYWTKKLGLLERALAPGS